jgi:hypothetical protein
LQQAVDHLMDGKMKKMEELIGTNIKQIDAQNTEKNIKKSDNIENNYTNI